MPTCRRKGLSLSVSTYVIGLMLAGAPTNAAAEPVQAVAPVPVAAPVQSAAPAPAAADTTAQETPVIVVRTPAATEEEQTPSAPVAGAIGTPLPDLPNLPGSETAAPDQAQQAGADDDEGGIIVTARRRYFKGDPLEGLNVASFQAVQAVDKAFVGPVAMGYKKNIPSPIRTGLRNFLTNIGEPIAFVNFLLQHRIGKAAETVGRFAINTTLGIVGLFDVAKRKPFNLPHRNNGIAYTLGFYGVGSGPYMFLPLIGPTTLRDVIGRVLDLMLVPTLAGSPFNKPAYALAAGTINSIDERAEADDTLRKLREESSDPYSAVRDHYLKQRQAEIDALHSHRKPKAEAKDAAAGAVSPEATPAEASSVAPVATDRVPPVAAEPETAGVTPGASPAAVSGDEASSGTEPPCVPDTVMTGMDDSAPAAATPAVPQPTAPGETLVPDAASN